MVDILLILILVLDFVISVWNSYAAGLSLGFVEVTDGPGWLEAFAVLGLAIGLLGGAYVLTIFLALVANAYGLIGVGAVNLLIASNFLVTGGLIIVLGIGMTAESIWVAASRPGEWTVEGSIYNVFASIWNVFDYIRNFGVAMNLIKSERRGKGQAGVILLAVISVIVAVLLSYIAFHFGRAQATGEYRGKLSDEDL